jgi:Xaa-Pro aminopeptidase
MAPIDRHLIDISLLNEDEKKWLNTYHKNVRDIIHPLLQKSDPDAADWLIGATEPL